MLLTFGCSSTLALMLLCEAADFVGRPATFNAVAERAIPGSGILVDAAIALKCFGVATSYLIVIGDSAPQAADAFGASGIWLERRVWTALALCIAGPLAYMRRITALRHTSLLGLCCVLLITVMVVLFARQPTADFQPCKADEMRGDVCKGLTTLAADPASVLRALPLFVFSYTCHQVHARP